VRSPIVTTALDNTRDSAPPSAGAGRQDIAIAAADGFRLAGTLFLPEGRPAATVAIGAATAVPRGFYAKFAAFLATRGFAVLTYDYRGIGDSKPAAPQGFDPRMSDWGRLDMEAAFRFLLDRFPDLPLLAVGHSAGGQVVPLAEHAHRLSGLLLVASQSGTWTQWSGIGRIRMWAIMHMVLPALVLATGRLPGWVLGGEPLPRGVALEWAGWCRHPDYILSHAPDMRDRFAALGFPVLSFGFTDDAFAPAGSIETLAGWYGGADKTVRMLTPGDIGQKQIGHFGFFRERVGRALWDEAAKWLMVAATRAG